MCHYTKITEQPPASDNSDRCICCGEVIPEGRQVCPMCEEASGEKKHDQE